MPDAAVAPPPAAPAAVPGPGGVPVVPGPPLSKSMQRMKDAFDKAATAAPVKPAAQAIPPAAQAAAEPKPGDAPPTEPKAADAPPVEPKIDDKAPAKGSAAQAWKLYDTAKKRITALETENLDLKGRILPESDVKELRDKLVKHEARIKEYEDEIRHTAYTKSDEFKTKYVAPYEKAWQRATKELSGIYISGENGQKRAMTPQDLLALVNMELGPARELADATFGAFSDDVMRYRNEIRGLADTQVEAIEEARKTGAQRDKERNEQMQRSTTELANEITKVWKDVNEAVAKDPDIATFFGPRDDDKEWNERLEKGFALVDRAFSEDPRNPKLTPNERREIIKRHTAVRNRAAGWGALRNSYLKAQREIEGLKKALEGYKQSTPGNGNGSQGAPAAVATARDRIAAAFIAKAK